MTKLQTGQKSTILRDFHLEPLTSTNLEEVYEFFKSNTPFFSLTLEFFRRGTLGDEGYDPEFSLILREPKSQKLIGAFIAVSKKGFVKRNCYLKACLIEQTYQRQGIGSKLLDEITRRAKIKLPWSAGIYFGDCPPRYWQPGVDLRHTALFFFLKKHGFKMHGMRFNLTYTLPDKVPTPAIEKEGYFFQRARPEDFKVTIQFVKENFRFGFWSREVSLSFENSPTTTFIATDASGNIVGWATHSAHFLGSFGPTGVKKSLRGYGIGGELLRWTIWDMRQMGIDTCTILWVVGDTRKYYAKILGAFIHPVFYPMGKWRL